VTEDDAKAEIKKANKTDPEAVIEAVVLSMLTGFAHKGDSRVTKQEIGADQVRVRMVLNDKDDPAWRHIEWHGPSELWDLSVVAFREAVSDVAKETAPDAT
jgi:hypothetical protein